MSNLVEVTDDTFERDVINSDIPTVVDLWAEWCGPCKMVSPILEELSGEYQDKVKFAQMNVDNNRETPGKFGVRAIPTLLLFKGGELAQTIVGARPKAEIDEEVKKLL